MKALNGFDRKADDLESIYYLKASSATYMWTVC